MPCKSILLHKIKPYILAEVQDIEIIRRMVLNGRGVAPINKLTALNAPGSEGLHILQPDQPTEIFDNVYLISKQQLINTLL